MESMFIMPSDADLIRRHAAFVKAFHVLNKVDASNIVPFDAGYEYEAFVVCGIDLFYIPLLWQLKARIQTRLANC